MHRVVFAESWRAFFAEVGLESFEDFYHYPGGIKIGNNERRSVYRLDFSRGKSSKVFYIKRFGESHIKDILSARRNFGRLTSQAAVEWGNANLLLQTGIDTYKPVCMGERTVLKVERKSFIVTEQLDATCLLDFVIKKWRTLERPRQDRIIVAMANLARRAHEADISLRDLYIWHLFINEHSLEGDCRLSVIDLHRMLRNVKSVSRKLMDLAALYWSMSGEYFDDGHRDLLVTTYVGDGQAGSKQDLLAGIRRRAGILDSRRTLQHHYEKVERVLKPD